MATSFRIGSYADDNEKMSVISLPLMAGGPISITDMPTGDDLKFFQNDEMLALHKDGLLVSHWSVTSGTLMVRFGTVR